MDDPKILIIEDNEISIFLLTRLLKKNNFDNLVVVNNGIDALNQIKNQQYSLILVEMMIPGMDGFELVRRIRQILYYKDIPIISVTVLAMREHIDMCFNAGVTDVVIKPFNDKEFIDKIHTIFTPL